jgi:triosephosphate isomerase
MKQKKARILLVNLMRRFVVGGNWKMQVTNVSEAIHKAESIARGLSTISNVDVFVAPSFNALYPVNQVVKDTKLKLAGQNMYFREKGAFTGQTSPLSLLDSNCTYVILGHSEPRRIFNETDEFIRDKLLKALEINLKPVLCIGETAKEREEGQTTDILYQQLSESLRGLSPEQIKQLVIAYEPVWAINNKYLNPDTEIRPASPREAEDAHRLTRGWLTREFGTPIANTIPIIYGGSMNAKNAPDLLAIEDIDGGLIGGASLSAEKFLPIIQTAAQLSKPQENFQWENNTLRFNE